MMATVVTIAATRNVATSFPYSALFPMFVLIPRTVITATVCHLVGGVARVYDCILAVPVVCGSTRASGLRQAPA
jgi:hypothetical protein